MKIVLYSVNISNYDKFNEPTIVDDKIDYFLFTDDTSYKSDIWKIKNIDVVDKKLDSRKKSRYLKINSHLVLPPHDISIYVDHNLVPQFTSAEEMLEEIEFYKSNIMIYKHPLRDCIYDEAKEVLKYRMDNPHIVNSQIGRYLRLGFPMNYGLYESGFIIRKNTPKVNFFNETWWTEVKNNSGRDQLSQMFASWYTNVKIDPIPIGESVEDNKFLQKKIKHEKTFGYKL